MSDMFVPKTIKISLFFSKFLLVMSRMVFGVYCSFFNADFIYFNFLR